MNLIHVVCLSDLVISGIKTVVSSLVKNQDELGHLVKVVNLNYCDSQILPHCNYIRKFSDFNDLLHSFAPDVVVFHGGYVMKYFYIAHRLRKERIPYIVVPHGGTSKHNLKKKRILKTLVNTLFTRDYIKKSSGVIFLNENEKANSIFLNIVKHYGFVPNGVNLPSINAMDYKFSSGKISFMFLSRIDIKYKGLDILLRAIEKVSELRPDLSYDFHFYGGHNDSKIVEKFELMLNNTNAPVFYHGEVYGQEKEEAYMRANIYVLPSLSEGMPVSVLEALSYGCPCIVTPQTNMADIILNKHAGWVSDPDVDSITATLFQAYSDYINCRKWYVTNSVNAVKTYSWGCIAQKSIQEYCKILQNDNEDE